MNLLGPSLVPGLLLFEAPRFPFQTLDVSLKVYFALLRIVELSTVNLTRQLPNLRLEPCLLLPQICRLPLQNPDVCRPLLKVAIVVVDC
jgi:hypothetical protein